MILNRGEKGKRKMIYEMKMICCVAIDFKMSEIVYYMINFSSYERT